MSYTSGENFKTKKLIDRFLNDISNGEVEKIKNKTIQNCLSTFKEEKWRQLECFLSDIYPLLELAFCWSRVKEMIKTNKYFFIEKKKRLIGKNPNNFIGTKFEIIVLGFLSLSSNIEILKVEPGSSSNAKNSEAKVDFVGKLNEENIEIECKYISGIFSKNKIKKIKDKVKKKFNSQCSKKILILGHEGFWEENPFNNVKQELNDLSKTVDSLVLHYRKKVEKESSIEIQQLLFPFNKDISWSQTFATQLTVDKKNLIETCFIRKFMVPEPYFEIAGEEEQIYKEKT